MSEGAFLKSDLAPKFKDVVKLLENCFGYRETPESIERQILAMNRKQFKTGSDYYFTKLHLINKLDVNMSARKKIKFLLKGLPKPLVEHILIFINTSTLF